MLRSNMAVLGAVSLALTACGGGAGQPPFQSSLISDGEAETVSLADSVEIGPPTKIIAVPGASSAAIALFPDGRVFYSPDGYNLGGGGATVQANGSGNLKVVDIAAVTGGIDALFSSGSAYMSPDGQNLAGGGSTVTGYAGTAKVTQIIAVDGGIDAVFDSGKVYFSPDGTHLGGGGSSLQIYSGTGKPAQIVPVGTGVVTRFDDGSVYYSADNRLLGGGGTGNTLAALPAGHSKVSSMVQVGGGVLTAFANGSVYLSPDGQNLAGGGSTIAVPSWDTSIPNGPWGPRDSAPGVSFLGHLWVSGGFRGNTGSDSCFSICSYFDLWASTDLTGGTWNSSPAFATATSPNPRDATSVVNNGVQDAPVPTDFYDAYAPILVWNGRMWAIGSTVWSTADGSHWQRQNLPDGVTAAAGPVSGRAGENSRALLLGSQIFFLEPDTGEVYVTADLTSNSWTDLGAIPGFTPRCGAAAFVLGGRMWIEGGGGCDYSRTYDEIWSSADGITWTKNASPTTWSARMWPCVAHTGDGIFWLAGGYAPTDWNDADGTVKFRYGANHSDVWYTRDAIHWMQFKAGNGADVPDGTALEPRHAATCYVTASKTPGINNLVVMNGTGGPDPNDADATVINSIRTLQLPLSSALP